MILKFKPFQPQLRLFFCIFLFIYTNILWAETEQEQAIQAPVNQLHETLINVMQTADSASFQERYDLLEKVITNYFNTPLISRVILSRYWKSIDEKAQADFINMFNRLTISTYVNRFDSYDGESFNNLVVEPMKKNRFMVKTELTQNDDKPVSFNYIVQNDNEEWKIISVIANGINDLSLKRAEYSSVIKDRGYDSLVKSLEEKISDLQLKSVQ